MRKSREKTNERGRGILLLLNVSIVLAAVIFLVSLGSLVSRIRRPAGGYSEDLAIYNLENQDFEYMIRSYINYGRGAQEIKDRDETEYVAQYALAAFYYKAAEKTGNTKEKDDQLENMKDAAGQLTELKGSMEDINRILGIDPER
jgi:hypothetical protein